MGNKKTGKDLPCGRCGKLIYIPVNRLLKDCKNHYCSLSCVGEARWDGKRVYPKKIGNCFLCQKDIIAKNGSMNKPNRKFCSVSCRTKVSNKLRVWKESSRKKLSEKLKLVLKGLKKPEIHRIKLRLANLGNKSHFWKGGLTKENTKLRNSSLTKEWRKKVFKRDNWTCVWCGVRSGKNNPVFLEADHIKSWSKYPDLRWVLANGRTLCKPCHRETETFGRKIKTKIK